MSKLAKQLAGTNTGLKKYTATQGTMPAGTPKKKPVMPKKKPVKK